MAKKPPQSGNNDDDAALWELVARSVKAYRPRKASRDSVSRAKPPAKADIKPALAKPSMTPPAPLRAGITPDKPRPAAAAGFDRPTAQKIKKGKLPIEGRLDLHGMTQSEALEALRRFLRAAERDGKRTVLVITGKGRIGGGVLRQQLPRWLAEEDFGRIVIAAGPAGAKDGGDGAFYLRLRKRK